MVKATFTFDEETFRLLKRTAVRLKRPQSEVVREAVRVYARQEERLPESERIRMLRVLDEMLARPPDRTQKEVDAEIREIREARRGRGRLHPVD